MCPCIAGITLVRESVGSGRVLTARSQRAHQEEFEMSTTAEALRVPLPTAATEVPGLRFGNAMTDAYVTVGWEA